MFFSEEEHTSRKRQIKQRLNDDDEDGDGSGIANSLLDELIVPSDLSIGVQILKKMGWKPGQGVGEKTEAIKHPNEQGAGKKVIEHFRKTTVFQFPIFCLNVFI